MHSRKRYYELHTFDSIYCIYEAMWGQNWLEIAVIYYYLFRYLVLFQYRYPTALPMVRSEASGGIYLEVEGGHTRMQKRFLLHFYATLS